MQDCPTTPPLEELWIKSGKTLLFWIQTGIYFLMQRYSRCRIHVPSSGQSIQKSIRELYLFHSRNCLELTTNFAKSPVVRLCLGPFYNVTYDCSFWCVQLTAQSTPPTIHKYCNIFWKPLLLNGMHQDDVSYATIVPWRSALCERLNLYVNCTLIMIPNCKQI